MVVEPPWAYLAQRRRQLQMTQKELADGVVTQSMICQIERGRILPSRQTLVQLARKLGEEEAPFVLAWEGWRAREQARETLWLAVQGGDVELLGTTLATGGRLLVPFEERVYRAFLLAARGDLDEAERAAWEAWETGGGPTVIANAGRNARSHGSAGAWTKIARARALVVEACVHEQVLRKAGRQNAAARWYKKSLDRLRHAAWRQ